MKHGNHNTERRDFLKLMAVCASAAVLSPVLRILPATASSLRQTTEQRMLMGTFVGITTRTSSSNQAQEAIGYAFAEMERLIAIMSRFESQTALSVFNTEGRLAGAPRELLDVVDYSQNLHQLSAGRFDITVAPVVNLLKNCAGKPSAKELRAALDLVDAGRVHCSGSNLEFAAEGMSVTLDGVAKGYIADCAAEVLTQHGITNFMIDAGGDIRVQAAPHNDAWRIAIEDPQKNGKYPAVLSIRSGAVATSGGYEASFNARGTSHHLIHPTTGASPQYIQSISVQAPTVMQADGLATTLSLMHPREALNLTNSLPGHDCLLITSTGTVLTSAQWG